MSEARYTNADANAVAVKWLTGQSIRPLLACAAVLLVAPLWQLRWGTVPDVSWIITMCERLLSGDRLYVDIIETNPPFTIWLYMPAVAAARALGLAPELVVELYVYGATLLGFVGAAYIARRAAFAENRALYAWSPVFLAVLVIFPGNAFGEREHFGVALLLPLIVLMAWRADPHPKSSPGIGAVLFAGACASVIMLVKPYYAPVLIFPALFAAWRSRRFSTFIAPEYWLILVICAAYLTAVLTLYPEYLRIIYPMLNDTYLRIWSIFPIIRFLIPYALLLFVAWRLRPRGASPLHGTALCASAGAILPLVYQGKGWPYHAYPAIALSTLALFYLLILRHEDAGLERSGGYRPAPLLIAALLAAAWAPFVSTQKPAADIVAKIRSATNRPTVALIGGDMAYGHPLTRMIGGRWISRYCSDWLGEYAMRLAQNASDAGNSAEYEHYKSVMLAYFQTKRKEFEDYRPDILIVQENDQGWVAPLLKANAFTAILDDYRLLTGNEEYEVLLRKDYRKPSAPGYTKTGT